MIWLEWARMAALVVAASATGLALLIGLFWLLTSPLGNGPQRIVDIENRGRTRIRLPDGRIR